MKARENSDWVALNNIIYQIYTTEDAEAMRRHFLEQLHMLIDFDSADFYLSDQNDPPGLTDPVTFHCDHPLSAEFDALDYSRNILYGGKSMVYRETDIISDENRRKTEYYQRVYRPNGWHYSMQMILARKKTFLGVVTLYRNIGKDNFLYDDIFILDMLREHMSYRLFQDRAAGRGAALSSVRQCAERFGLTRREETVLSLLVKGMDSESICRELVISINTLRKHTMNIYHKVNVTSRVQLLGLFRSTQT